MWIEFQNNPVGRKVGDCAVRAISKALNMGWEAAYIALVINGLQMGDMPSSNSVIGATLRQHGFRRKNLPDDCPDCFTVADFAEENPKGVYVAGTGNHVVTIIDSDWYDSWDSGSEVPQYVWYRASEDVHSEEQIR